MTNSSLLILSLCLVACLAQQTAFTANVLISNKPGVSGSLRGFLSFNGPLSVMRINYTIGPVEFFNYAKKIRNIECNGNCDTQTYTAPMPILYAEASDTVTGGTYGACTQRAKGANSGASSIYVDAANNICRAMMVDGSIIDFSGWGAAEPASSFVPLSTCPVPLCTKRIDFELIFDESGSIADKDFVTEKEFAASVAKSFTWGYDYVGMGLVMFATVSKLSIPLTFSQNTFVQQSGMVRQSKGSTCIGCGIATAWSDIVQNGRMIPGTNTPVTRVFIVLTDGENNVGDFTIPLGQAKNNGVIFFAIGIGASLQPAQVNTISSNLPGITTAYFGTDWSKLPGMVQGLVTATCVDIPGNPCGTSCRGFCACGGNCMCPDVCDDGNKCTDDSCAVGINGNGCIHPAHDCNDGNACTADSCDPATQCVKTPIVCNDNDVCTTDSCNPSVGCVYAAISCDDGSPCTTDTCNHGPSGGCVNTPINNCAQVCQDPTKPINCPYIKCKVNECDVSKNGDCTPRDRLCADTNLCTIDTCNPTTDLCVFTLKNCTDASACTIDYCDPATGQCRNDLINATAVCNDFNACTLDTCDPKKGCIHTKLTCSDGLTCTDDMCSTVTGCYNPPVDCWKSDPDLANHPSLIGCYEAECIEPKGCQLTGISNTTVDACQVCNGDGSSCDANIGSDTAVGLGAGAIAGVVIGAVVVAAVLGALGGKKGYDVWLKHRNNMQGANTNPMYTSNGLSGNNPMYRDSGAA